MADVLFYKVWFDPRLRNDPSRYQMEAIRQIAGVFQENILRGHRMIGFLSRWLGTATRHVQAIIAATFEHTGKLTVTDDQTKDKDLLKRISDTETEIVRQWQIADMEKDQMDEFLTGSGTFTMSLMQRYDQLDSSELRSLLEYILLNGWAAFEVLAEDLWIAALNHGPKSLAEGVISKAEKITLKTRSEQGKKADKAESKMVPLSVIKDHRYDLREKMGTLLVEEEKVNFNSFENTLLAYEAAFGPLPTLSKTGADCSNIGVLEAIRNLLLHKAGRCDQKFKRRVESLKHASVAAIGSLRLGETIPLDGPLVKTLMESLVKVGDGLLAAVDSRSTMGIVEFEI